MRLRLALMLVCSLLLAVAATRGGGEGLRVVHHRIGGVAGGDGYAPTNEEQGLAAMSLAAIVKRNEESVSAAGFLTHEGRFTQHRRSLITKGPKTRRGT